MAEAEKKWSILTAVNLVVVIWFALVTNHCETQARRAQQAIPPPPPDDYIGALFMLMLYSATTIFGFLFVVSLLVLIFLFIKNKYFAKSQTTEIIEKPEL